MNRLKTVGTSSKRVEGMDKLNGISMYPQDIFMQDELIGLTIRSEIAHANFKANYKKALKLDGVVDILTSKDVSKNEHGVLFKDHQVFCDGTVKRVGDPIALIIAENLEIAKEASKLVQIDYTDLPGVFSLEESLKNETIIHNETNVIAEIKIDKGQVDFDKCDFVVEETFEVPSVEHAFLQPEASIAYLEGERVVVVSSTQYPHWDQIEIAEAIGLDTSKVKVINATVGGAFGGREDITSQIHAAIGALKIKRPIKIIYSREESVLAHSKRHAMEMKMKMGANREGKLIALKGEILADTGAYASWAPNILRKACVHASGPYEIPNVYIEGKSLYTNNPFAGAMRGFGATQVAVAYEQLIDMLAEKMGISNYELRLRNVLKVGSKTATSQVMYNSVPIEKCLRIAEEELNKLRGNDKPNVLTGYGLALSIYGTGYGNGFPDVSNNVAKINEDGLIEISSGFTEVGQGAKTVMAQIASEVFNTDPSKIVINCENTDNTPDTGTAAASRQTYNTGNAVKKSCESLKDKILDYFVNKFELNNKIGIEIENEEVYLKTLPSKRMLFSELSNLCLSGEGTFTAQTTTLDDCGQGAPYWPYGFNALGVKVEIDPKSGHINVVDGVFVQDVGKAINPRQIEGQMDGGFVMGLGYALYEDLNIKNGHIINKKFSNYILPTSKDMPTLKKIIVEDPEETGPYGAKGIGESVTIPVAPAILNAIFDASGVRFTKLPVTPVEFMKKFGG